MSRDDEEFQDLYARIGAHVATAMHDATPAQMASILTVLAGQLGNAIAVAGNGDKKMVDTLWEGASHHMHEIAVERTNVYDTLKRAFKQ